MRYNVFIDGSCKPNPGGIATYGLVFMTGFAEEGTDPKKIAQRKSNLILFEESGFIGKGEGMSNNVGEYVALIQALKLCQTLYWPNKKFRELVVDSGSITWVASTVATEKVIIHTDSSLVFMQMEGLQKAHGGLYYPYYLEAKEQLELCRQLGWTIEFCWIKSADNLADKPAKQALIKAKKLVRERIKANS
jgi:ribonuclease HI